MIIIIMARIYGSRRYYGRANYGRFRKGNKRRRRPADKQYSKRRFARKAVTYPSKNSAYKVAVYQNPIMLGGSKLVHNQLFYSYNNNPLTGTIGAFPKAAWRANSVYDPNTIAGPGQHNAIGFQQMMLYYEHFTVIRSKITVTFWANNDYQTKCVLYLSPDGALIGDPREIMENGQIKTSLMGVTRRTTLTLDCDVKRFFGRKSYRDMLDDTDLRGDVSAPPIEQVYFVVGAYDPFGASEDGPNVGYDVLISYDVIYTEPKKLQIST